MVRSTQEKRETGKGKIKEFKGKKENSSSRGKVARKKSALSS